MDSGLSTGLSDTTGFLESAATGFPTTDTATSTEAAGAAVGVAGSDSGSMSDLVLSGVAGSDSGSVSDLVLGGVRAANADSANLTGTVAIAVNRFPEDDDNVTPTATPPPPIPPEVISQAIAPVLNNQGANLETPDGLAELVVPPGSLPAAVAGKTVEVELKNLDPAAVPTPPASVAFIRAVEINTLVDGMRSPVTYGHPVTLRFPFTIEDVGLAGGDPSNMIVFRYDPAMESWDPVPSTYIESPPPPFLQAMLNSFSLFAVGVLQSIPPTATPSSTPTGGGGCGAPAYGPRPVDGGWPLLVLATIGLMLCARIRRS